MKIPVVKIRRPHDRLNIIVEILCQESVRVTLLKRDPEVYPLPITIKHNKPQSMCIFFMYYIYHKVSNISRTKPKT